MLSKIKKNEKGFTLMEMLIVVAIIAVLVAIAIPTFNSSLNKAKVAADQANIRAGYASAMVQVLAGDIDDTTSVYYLMKDGSVKAANNGKAPDGAYTCQGKTTTTTEIAGQNVAAWAHDGDKYITYTYAETAGTGGTSTFTFTIAPSAD